MINVQEARELSRTYLDVPRRIEVIEKAIIKATESGFVECGFVFLDGDNEEEIIRVLKDGGYKVEHKLHAIVGGHLSCMVISWKG